MKHENSHKHAWHAMQTQVGIFVKGKILEKLELIFIYIIT